MSVKSILLLKILGPKDYVFITFFSQKKILCIIVDQCDVFSSTEIVELSSDYILTVKEEHIWGKRLWPAMNLCWWELLLIFFLTVLKIMQLPDQLVHASSAKAMLVCSTEDITRGVTAAVGASTWLSLWSSRIICHNLLGLHRDSTGHPLNFWEWY